MREELGASSNKWPKELAGAEESRPQPGAPITPEEKLAAELADELSRMPEDGGRPHTQLYQPVTQQQLFDGQKRKVSGQQVSTGVAGIKRQRKSGDKSSKQQAAESSVKPVLEAAAAGGQEQPKQVSENVCAACCKPIHERYLLMALDKRWHEDCLKCACCDCRLAEVGSSLFLHSDKILCRRDFARIFGPAGICAACKQLIPPHEMVMRAHRHAYHMDCFRCLKCLRAFCVGDPYYLNESQRILCVDCHELADDTRAPASAAEGAMAATESPPQVGPARLDERPEVELVHQVTKQQTECASS